MGCPSPTVLKLQHVGERPHKELGSAAGKGDGTSFCSSRSSLGAFCPLWRARMEKEATLSFQKNRQISVEFNALNKWYNRLV